MRGRRLGLTVLGAGFLLLVTVYAVSRPGLQVIFDGAVVEEPYRYLSPPPGAPEDPGSYSDSQRPRRNGQSPAVVAYTTETPPQAQIYGYDNAFDLPAGTTRIDSVVTPIAPPALPTEGHIAGNVYHVDVTNQDGVSLVPRPKALVSMALRAPEGTHKGKIAIYVDGGWHELKTDPSGLPYMFLARIEGFGDFAVIAPGPDPNATPTPAVEVTPEVTAGAGSGGATGAVPSTARSPTPTAVASQASAGAVSSPGPEPAGSNPSSSAGSSDLDVTQDLLVLGAIAVVLIVGGVLTVDLVRRARERR